MRSRLHIRIGLLVFCAVVAGCGEQTPRMSPAPTPPVSTAPASPLVAPGHAIYRGETSYTGKPPIEVAYDPETWYFVADEDAPALSYAAIKGCILVLRYGVGEAVYVGEIDLGAWRWSVYNNGPQFPDALHYVTLLADYAAGFTVMLPAGGAERERTACRDAAEAVIATFVSTDTSATPHAPSALTASLPFAADDTSSWPRFDADPFTILHPPGWTVHAQANVDSSYWLFSGLLPAARADHFQVRGGVTVVQYANPEHLPLAQWVAHLPANEREMTLQPPRTLTISARPAIAITAHAPWTGQTYIRTWMACGDTIWQISMLGGFKPALQAELEAIYAHMAASFHCTSAP